jgi:serine/threonine-protein kinase
MGRLIWIYDVARGTATRLTSEGYATSVNWTPDGLRVVFDWRKTGEIPNLYWQSADLSSPKERLTTSGHGQHPGSFSQDGKNLSFVELVELEDNAHIMLLQLRDRKVTPFMNSRFTEANPEFSPDGRWIAYVSNESGRDEVYVQPFPGPGRATQISIEGGREPLWSRDSKQLFYRQSKQVWAVDVQTARKPRLLFEQEGYGLSSTLRAWDISADGKRFLMVKLEERKPQPATEMILVHNWFEELKRLVPIGKK